MDLFYNEKGWIFKKNLFDKYEINRILKLIDDYILKHNNEPRIGIINIGTENNKGLEFLKEAAELIMKARAHWFED